MKNKNIIWLLVIFVLMLSVFSTAVFAETSLMINSVTFNEYIDEYGAVDDTLVTVKVNFTVTGSSEQVSVLLASEDIAEISDATKPKIIYMSQDFTPGNNVYEFAVEKSKIQSATGLSDIEGCTLYVKLGGKEVSGMATQTVVYASPGNAVIPGDVDGDEEVTNRDATLLLRYLVRDITNVNTDAMDVDGDNEITNRDGTVLLRYLAGWNIELQ